MPIDHHAPLTPTVFGLLLVGIAASLALPAQKPAAPDYPPTELFGSVHDVSDQPVPAAQLTAHDEYGRLLGKATTDGTGLFRIAKLPIDRDFVEVRATARGCAAGSARSFVRPFWSPRHVRIQLGDAVQLHGEVRAGGRPAQNANVVLWQPHGNSPPYWVTCDADGRFTIATAPVGKVVLRAAAPGSTMVQRNLTLAADTDVQLDLAEGEGSTVALQVGGADTPPPELAALSCTTSTQLGVGPLPLGMLRPATGANTFAQVCGLPCADVLGIQVADDQHSWVPWCKDGVATLTRSQSGMTEVQVLDDGNRPVRGLVLRARWPNLSGRNHALVRTDNTGRCRLQLPQGQSTMFAAYSPGWVVWDPTPAGIDSRPIRPATADAIQLGASRAVPIRGRVIDQHGAGVVNVEVRLTMKGHQHADTCPTASDGSFEFTRNCLPDTPCAVSVVDGRMTPATPGVETVVTVRRIRCSGVVLDDQGATVPGASLRWHHATPWLAPPQQIRADRHGRFQCDVFDELPTAAVDAAHPNTRCKIESTSDQPDRAQLLIVIRAPTGAPGGWQHSK